MNWSKIALPNSPLLGYAVHTHQDSKVVLTGRGLKEATVREEAEFQIDGTQAGPGNVNYCQILTNQIHRQHYNVFETFGLAMTTLSVPNNVIFSRCHSFAEKYQSDRQTLKSNKNFLSCLLFDQSKH